MPIFKNDGQTNQPIAKITYTDGATDRDITAVFKNDAGTWRQVFGASVSAETLAWSASTPTGTYLGVTNEFEGLAVAKFLVTTAGTFSLTLVEIDGGGTGTPLSGTFRPGVTGVDLTNYEVSLLLGTVAGDGVRSGSGSMTDITGTFQPLDASGSARIQLIGIGSGSVAVTLEIREIATPSNTTGPATFTLSVIVTS